MFDHIKKEKELKENWVNNLSINDWKYIRVKITDQNIFLFYLEILFIWFTGCGLVYIVGVFLLAVDIDIIINLHYYYVAIIGFILMLFYLKFWFKQMDSYLYDLMEKYNISGVELQYMSVREFANRVNKK
tara:strand:- start:125 stop:514 length:390 start_codon:yes stop_codon:yes gene_type:complete